MEMALEQLLLAFAQADPERGKGRADKIDWDDLCLAFEMAREALPGRYLEIVAQLKAQDEEDANAPARLGDEIIEQERSMEAVNDGFESLAKSIESIR